MGDQLVAVGATLVWSGVLTFVILKVLQLVIPGGLRVSEEDEETGLDLTQHSEVGLLARPGLTAARPGAARCDMMGAAG